MLSSCHSTSDLGHGRAAASCGPRFIPRNIFRSTWETGTEKPPIIGVVKSTWESPRKSATKQPGVGRFSHEIHRGKPLPRGQVQLTQDSISKNLLPGTAAMLNGAAGG